MTGSVEYPLVVLPRGIETEYTPRRPLGGGAPNPKKARQLARLAPQFLALQQVLDSRGALISETAAATAPEHILVFVTNGARKEFIETLASLPDLEWILQHDEKVEPDDDFRYTKPKDYNKELTACFYMVVFNQKALEQLLHFWKAYQTTPRMPPGLGSWGKVFSCLREIRRWGPEDRLREADLLRDWLEPLQPNRDVPVEIELWAYGSAVRRHAAEAEVAGLVAQAGGRVLHTASIPEIRYHAILAALPQAAVHSLFDGQSIALIKADDVYLLRSVPQCAARIEIDIDGAEAHAVPTEPLPTESRPVCALLDGLPMENHPLLRGRLVVDDPDGWSATYPVADRRHGTAMASLIVHGDLHQINPPLPTPLHVQPILRPEGQYENAPRHRLWVDVIHQAVRRMLVGHGSTPPTAPTVRVINLSIGDSSRPFLFELSALARLLDWLSWQHQVLFVISAGNHDAEIPAEVSADDHAVVRHLFRQTRQRRILSPAESINGLAVGSLNLDGDGPAPTGRRHIVIPARTDIPAAYSAHGRGFRRSVKPDALMPGGRQLFEQQLPTPSGGTWRGVQVQRQLGQLVATPGVPGRPLTTRAIGTSNAAALASRSATFTYEAIRALREAPTAAGIADLPDAVLLKALLVHTAEWSTDAEALCKRALLGDVDANRIKDHLAGVLGYGALRPERALACGATRATMVGGGMIGVDRREVYRLPVPSCLQARTEWRRLTLTLAWFSPINPADRRYRVARLRLDAQRATEPLNVTGAQVHGDAAVRGTVQHMVMETSGSAMLVSDDSDIEFAVSCVTEGGPLAVPVPYAVVVSLETAPNTDLPIYDQTVELLRTRARVRP